MENEIKEKNYWPHAIVVSIILVIIACAWTIKVAIDNPVQMDSFYFEKYQDVDHNIDKIQAKQKAFFERFDIMYEQNSIQVGKSFNLALSIFDKKSKTYLQNATITLLITRPDTNEFNQEFQLNEAKEDKFILKNIVVKKPGRWQLLTKIKHNEYEGFHKYEVFAAK